jgi:hypothetical protein
MMARSRDKTTDGQHESAVRYIRNSKTISGRLHDELVMMDIDQGKYFSLNPVATRIWDLLEKYPGVDELCRQLMEEYEVDFSQCTKEVVEYLNEMLKLGLVLKEEI